MCEYCGCQALASIDALTREHEQVLALISDVRAAQLAGDADVADQVEHLLVLAGERVDRGERLAAAVLTHWRCGR